jgi:hypothetical protein
VNVVVAAEGTGRFAARKQASVEGDEESLRK